MLVIAVAYKAKKGKREEALKAARICSGKTRAEPGNLDYTFYSGIDDDQSFFLFELWESREALDGHMKSGHLAVYREALKDLLEGKPEIRMYEAAGMKTGL